MGSKQSTTKAREPAEAARSGDVRRVRKLVTRFGVAGGVQNEHGKTPLMLAAEGGKLDIVCYLVAAGADLDAATITGYTALMVASRSGNLEVARFLVEAGASVNAVSSDGETPLMIAAEMEKLDVARCLVTAGAEVNATHSNGKTPLMIAVASGSLKIVRSLVNAGADVKAKHCNGKTPLMFGVGASSEIFMFHSWKASNPDLLRLLINAGADINAARSDGVTALARAAEFGDLDAVRLLVDAGAIVNVVTEQGMTPLMYATVDANLDMVRYLVDAGAEIDAHAGHETQLIEAVRREKVGIIRCLIDTGADLNAASNDGTTPLIEAARREKLDALCVLVDAGADVNAAQEDGMTALMYAAQKSSPELAQYLLDNGADANLTNKHGQTAIFFAQKASRDHTSDLLLRRLRRARDAPGLTNDEMAPKRCRTLRSWFIPPYEVALQTTLGTPGEIGGEYRAKWLDADVVVKLFIPGASGTTFADEVTVWHQLRHPNVIKLFGACDGGLHFFVCELASNGSLLEHITARGIGDGQRTPWKFLHGAALGLAYLHERKIFHGNLRCRNILIGADGLAKLANFELSGSTKSSTSGMFFKSTRWQSPERLKGKKASFASDVYSLGLCIFEVLTGEVPWARYDAYFVPSAKDLWDPSSQADEYGPGPLTPEVHKLLARMCCHNTNQRLSASSAVRVLQGFAADEALEHQRQPEPEPSLSIDEFRSGNLRAKRDNMRKAIAQQGLSALHVHLFNELEALFERLEGSRQPWKMLQSFYALLDDFIGAIHAGSHQNRILRLSSTRATNKSILTFWHRVEAVWGALGYHQRSKDGRKPPWKKHRAQQMEAFVSEVSETLLVLNDLGSEDDRVAFLVLLKGEIDARGSGYSETQLAVLRKAYKGIECKDNAIELMTAPAWFLPWYELVVDNANCVGEGGFGSVYRAKWLDSEVVIKQVKALAASNMNGFSFDSLASSSASAVRAPVETSDDKAKRQEMRRMFEREIGVWFGLSHPHVVRLFGACHVGIPFFACEYASNGSLDEYLRTHLSELWQKLYEASLGVQYLHARGIVHGDLKCNNIVVGSDAKAKVTDFGLSSEAALKGQDEEVQLSGAWQWVAPECLNKGASQRSSASDVYALGMCIVEALRVVTLIELEKDERDYYPTPWGNLDNASVKHHVVQMQKLPLRPELCSDEQWALVEKMCANDPAKRVRISTAVGELASLAGVESPNDAGKEAANALPRSISDVIAEMKVYTSTPRGSRSSGEAALRQIYQLLWDRLDDLTSRITEAPGEGESLRQLVESAASVTMELHECPDTLIAFSEASLRGCALHRKLDKFMNANLLVRVRDGGDAHD